MEADDEIDTLPAAPWTGQVVFFTTLLLGLGALTAWAVGAGLFIRDAFADQIGLRSFGLIGIGSMFAYATDTGNDMIMHYWPGTWIDRVAKKTSTRLCSFCGGRVDK